MIKKMSKKEAISISLILIIIGVTSRLLPHLWNTTPISAIALFSTAYIGLRYSSVIFISIMLVSDLFLGFYQWPIMLSVYGSFALAILIGSLLEKKRTMGLIFKCTLASSILFFVITNFAVWQFSTMYSHSFSGLLQSYFMALPFFRNSLLGDIFYAGILFGAYEGITLFYQTRSVSRKMLKTK